MNTSSIILAIWLVFFVLDYFVEWILDILNMNTIIKNRATIPSYFAGSIDEETHARTVKYSLRKSRFGLINSIQSRVFVILILCFHATGLLDNILASRIASPYWHSLCFLLIAFSALQILSLPASLYSKFVIEEEFGFNTSGLRTVFADILKGSVVGVILLMALLAGLYATISWTGELWWLAAWAFVTLFQLTVTILYPLIIAPLFNKFQPLPEGELKEKLTQLAERCQFAVKGIFVMDGSRRSRHSNAYFTGIGRFRRIVIFDTLIESLQVDELESVLAHEIGHWKHGHIRTRLLIGLVINLLLFALAGLTLKWLPLFQAFGFTQTSLHAFLFISSYFVNPVISFFSPLTNAQSRRHEYQADRYASKITGKTDAMCRALIELGRSNLTNLSPHPAYSFWHYSHPALIERLSALKKRDDDQNQKT